MFNCWCLSLCFIFIVFLFLESGMEMCLKKRRQKKRKGWKKIIWRNISQNHIFILLKNVRVNSVKHNDRNGLVTSTIYNNNSSSTQKKHCKYRLYLTFDSDLWGYEWNEVSEKPRLGIYLRYATPTSLTGQQRYSTEIGISVNIDSRI